MSSDETDEIVWKNYTNRHKRRLANKRSLTEFKKIYKKVKKDKAYHIVNHEDNQMDFFCNYSHTKNVVSLQPTDNIINVQVAAKDYESKNKEIFNKYNTSEDLEIQSGNRKNDTENVVNNRNCMDFEIASDASDEFEQNDVNFEIKQWAMDYKICLNALTSLLQILNKRTNITFPKDGRTLMKTPKTINIICMDEGFYCHFGVELAIHKIIEDRISSKIYNFTINLIVSTDGAPIGISSGKAIWPILCYKLLPKVRIIGIYYGQNKPKDSNKFLEAFVNELISYISYGFVYNGISYKIRLHALVCDAPAKAFVLKVKNHTGYNSCTKYLIHGDRIDDTICFPMENNPLLRNDEIFRNFEFMKIIRLLKPF